ncbi:MAG: hypothetical protein IPH00_06345 [Flavobacteriales bacterium]|nr:hypothetical protein [Flavobacteriales bacterium]
MNPYRNTIRTTGAMALISVVLNVFAQVPLVPAWEHTWTFGQDPVPGLIAPPAADDHVVVDPVSGLVHCTISDEDLLFSPRNELLFSFDPSGAEVTAAQPPVLGKAQFQSLYDSPYNGHITFGFGVTTVFSWQHIAFNKKLVIGHPTPLADRSMVHGGR